jgi:hypothetical protein
MVFGYEPGCVAPSLLEANQKKQSPKQEETTFSTKMHIGRMKTITNS